MKDGASLVERIYSLEYYISDMQVLCVCIYIHTYTIYFKIKLRYLICFINSGEELQFQRHF